MSDAVPQDEDAALVVQRDTWVQRRLSGPLAGAPSPQLVCRPDRLSGVLAAIRAPEGRSLIARGGGQSHGDSALNDGGAVVLMTRLDRMLSFDTTTGVLIAEAGVTIGDILRTFLPRGFALAVCPGSSRTTLGGAIAADVHGDNHRRAGSFGASVRWFDLVSPQGGLRRVSPDDQPAVFDATVGGMGLTGFIARAAIQLASVESDVVAVRREAVATLEAILDRLATASEAHQFASAWIDVLADSMSQGRGVLETADIARAGGGGTKWPFRAVLGRSVATVGGRVPMNGPFRRLRDEHRYRRARAGAKPRLLTLDRFLFRVEDGPDHRRWRRFQCVLPQEGAVAAIRRLLDIARRGAGTARADVGLMGAAGRGLLSFARPGVSLTIGLPNVAAVPDLMHRLERETLDRGGCVFLGYDAHLTDHGFAAMYPRLDEFRAVLDQLDPEMCLQSDLARRVRLRAYVV